MGDGDAEASSGFANIRVRYDHVLMGPGVLTMGMLGVGCVEKGYGGYDYNNCS